MATGTNGANRPNAEPHIVVRNLTMAYGSFVLMRDLNFVVRRGDIFIIMGGSGCGKSTLLRHLIGLKAPATGEPVSASAGMAARPASASPDSQLTIGVGPVDFPDYLRRLPVVTRLAPNRIDLSDERRWAEPLDKNFVRVFSENLVVLLDTQRIEKYPWSLRTNVDYQVEIDVQRFETTSDGQTQLVANWIIRDGHGGKILYASQTTAGAPAGHNGVSASAALSGDLATLSKEIASRVTELAQHHDLNNSESNSASAL